MCGHFFARLAVFRKRDVVLKQICWCSRQKTSLFYYAEQLDAKNIKEPTSSAVSWFPNCSIPWFHVTDYSTLPRFCQVFFVIKKRNFLNPAPNPLQFVAFCRYFCKQNAARQNVTQQIRFTILCIRSVAITFRARLRSLFFRVFHHNLTRDISVNILCLFDMSF